MSKERIIYLDYAKVFCTFLVVFAHLYSVYSPERIFIYSFHMPFFFLLSGMFHKDLSLRESVAYNFKKLIVPTIFYLLVFYAIFSALNTCKSGIFTPPPCTRI